MAADTEIVLDGTRIEFTEEAGVLIIHLVEDHNAGCTRGQRRRPSEVTLRGPTR